MKTFLLAVGVSLSAPISHDFFVSICTIRYSEGLGNLDITWRMTTHDVEYAMNLEQGRSDLSLDDQIGSPQVDNLLADLLLRHLDLNLNGQKLTIRFLGKEVELDETFCYLQVEDVKDPGLLIVRNSFLQDHFTEQENVVHLEMDGRTRSHSFLYGNAAQTFDLRP